jgi:hypothetical protein
MIRRGRSINVHKITINERQIFAFNLQSFLKNQGIGAGLAFAFNPFDPASIQKVN